MTDNKTPTGINHIKNGERKTRPKIVSFAYGGDKAGSEIFLFAFGELVDRHRNNDAACDGGKLPRRKPVLRQAAHCLRQVLRETVTSAKMLHQRNNSATAETNALRCVHVPGTNNCTQDNALDWMNFQADILHNVGRIQRRALEKDLDETVLYLLHHFR